LKQIKYVCPKQTEGLFVSHILPWLWAKSNAVYSTWCA